MYSYPKPKPAIYQRELNFAIANFRRLTWASQYLIYYGLQAQAKSLAHFASVEILESMLLVDSFNQSIALANLLGPDDGAADRLLFGIESKAAHKKRLQHLTAYFKANLKVSKSGSIFIDFAKKQP